MTTCSPSRMSRTGLRRFGRTEPMDATDQTAPKVETRHGKHRTDRYYFATWFDLEFFAKLRKFAKMQCQTIAETVRNNLSVVHNVQLDDEDRAWIESQMAKRATKRF